MNMNLNIHMVLSFNINCKNSDPKSSELVLGAASLANVKPIKRMGWPWALWHAADAGLVERAGCKHCRADIPSID